MVPCQENRISWCISSIVFLTASHTDSNWTAAVNLRLGIDADDRVRGLYGILTILIMPYSSCTCPILVSGYL